MKKYKSNSRIRTVFLVFLLSACTEDILDKTPLDQYADEVLWADVNLADAYLMNVYSLVNTGFHGEMLSSLGGETLVARGPNGTDYLKGLTSPDNTRGPHRNRHRWDVNFDNIQRVNLFLDNIDK